MLTEKIDDDDFKFVLWVTMGTKMRKGRCLRLIVTGQHLFSAVIEQAGHLVRWVFPAEALVFVSGIKPFVRPPPSEEQHARLWHDEGYIDCDVSTLSRLWVDGPFTCIGVHNHGEFVTRHLVGANAFRLLEMSRDTPEPVIVNGEVHGEDWPELWDNSKDTR